MQSQLHYEFTGETKTVAGRVLHRIRARHDFAEVKAGEIGGWIESARNLSGNAWVCEGACVYDNAHVYGSARVYDNAQVCGYAWVYDNAQVYGYARIFGYARVYDNAQVYDDARVYDDVWVYGYARIFEYAHVYGNAHVYGSAHVYGRARIFGYARVYDNAQVYGNALICGSAEVCGSALVGVRTYLVAGKWDTSPIQIQGSRDFVHQPTPHEIVIGCQSHEIAVWLEKYEEIGREHGYTPAQIKEYGFYIRAIAARMAQS